jgi:PPOX class probable F420-dependent enzyme
MTDGEIRAFLAERKTLIVCSNGPHQVPHPVPMWFIVDPDGTIRMTTYAKSQKVQNLRRDPRVSLLVESGERYEELRGVIFYGRAMVTDDTDQVLKTLMAVTARQRPEQSTAEAMKEAFRTQASKRVEIRIAPDRIVSWDHTKLGGVY